MRRVPLLVVSALATAAVAAAEPRSAPTEAVKLPVAGMAAAALSAVATGAGATAIVERAAEKTRAAGRLWSKDYTTWIWSEPRKGSTKLGYVRVGTSVALRSRERVAGMGCAGGFVPVEPRGYVCMNRTAALSTEDRYLRSMQLVQPGSGPLPYRYALSNGAPMYRRLPTAQEIGRAERFLGKPGTFKPLSWGNRGHEKLAEVRAIEANAGVPFFLENRGAAGSASPLATLRRTIPLGSMLAYTRSFEHEGRTWLLSADGTVVPADRVRPFRPSAFAGVELGREAALPIAWIRKKPRPKYERAADGSFSRTDAAWALRSAVRLDGGAEPAVTAHGTFLKTLEVGATGAPQWIAKPDATVVREREKLPFSVTEDDKWIIISISSGTLVAYEGTKPVFATLVSPGVGGIPMPGRDPVKMSTTPMGIYRVTYKHVAATMSPEKGENRSFWIADVPYTQYFNAPFALHVAYWHESFGEGMSAGCVNLSPKDGKRLFGWTDPQVPEGWNGAAAGSKNGPGTHIVVVR